MIAQHRQFVDKVENVWMVWIPSPVGAAVDTVELGEYIYSSYWLPIFCSFCVQFLKSDFNIGCLGVFFLDNM